MSFNLNKVWWKRIISRGYLIKHILKLVFHNYALQVTVSSCRVSYNKCLEKIATFSFSAMFKYTKIVRIKSISLQIQQILLSYWRFLSLLKLVSTIFFQIFIFHQMIALQNYEKCFLFHLKSSFRSRDIQFFVFPSSPLFFPVSRCFGGWSKKNLKVYDVINCLNKKLITHFVWCLEKEIRCDIETLFIERELNKEYFHGKIVQKMCTKI